MSLRMLITGSRDWADYATIETEMIWHAIGYTDITVVHGACPRGADNMADHIARARGWGVKPYPANWRRWGRRAGYRRNAAMVADGADICLAFIYNQSPGASMCAELAENADIPTHRFLDPQESA